MSAHPMHLGLPDPTTKPELYAGILPKRGVAWVIDTVITALMCVLVLPFTLFLGVFVFPLLMLVVGFIYRWFSVAGGSSTWGMRMMGIELRDADGMKLQSGTALAHTGIYTFSVLFAPLQIISIVMMVFTDRTQGLSDLVLGTAAINRPAA